MEPSSIPSFRFLVHPFAVFSGGIEARAIARPCSRHIPMPHHNRLGKHPLQYQDQILQLLTLRKRAGIRRFARRIQPALVADPNRTTVVRSAVGSHFQQVTVLGHSTVLSYIKVVANLPEPPLAVV
jgi:hypothetical protein